MKTSDAKVNKLFSALLDDARALSEMTISTTQREQELVIEQRTAQWQRERRAAAEMSEHTAAFHFRNASAINTIATKCPDYPNVLIKRYLPGLPLTLEQLATSSQVIEDILDWQQAAATGNVLRENPCYGRSPVILTAPDTLEAGFIYTITGRRFGTSTGQISLTVGPAFAAPVDLPILDWSDEAVRFSVPRQAPAGTPFHAPARLTLSANTGAGGSACSTTIEAIYEPPGRIAWTPRATVNRRSYALPPHSYSEEHTFTSPVLPPRAEPFTAAPLWNGGDLFIDLVTNTGTGVADDPATFEVVAGPLFTTANERQVQIRVDDDYYWDYTLTVIFHIVQPEDEPLWPGWESNP